MTLIRKALIINNPGEVGASNYCEGVNQDVDLYKSFLKSPLGGGWRENEIKTMKRPSQSEARNAVKALGDADYAFIVFSGHGYYSSSKASTILELKAGEELDSLDLRLGTTKRTVILDCCREVHAPLVIDEAMRKAFARADSVPDTTKARRCFDKEIADCPQGVIGLFGCSIGQRAGDDPQEGGFYSLSLIRAAEAWARGKRPASDTYYSMSVASAHDDAIAGVQRLSGGKQTPIIQKPRSEPYFPFAILA